MATGGFKSNAAADFLEEWKAKREKMRAKMLGDIAAATGTLSAANANTLSTSTNNSNGNPDRSASSGNCLETRPPVHPVSTAPIPPATPGASLKKGPPPQTEKIQSGSSACSSSMACNDSDKESPSPSKGREKKSSGPSARKGKGQIEKRKLREKRRSTGVVSIPSNESLDELDDDDVVPKDRTEEELVQANTFQNEAMIADPTTEYLMSADPHQPASGHLDFCILDTPRSGSGRQKSFAGPGADEEVGGNGRQKHNRHAGDGGAAVASLEQRLEELEMELAREREENAQLLKAHEEKDDLIGKLREEIDLLNRDLDDIEDENDQLKQENKTLLKVVGQLTR